MNEKHLVNGFGGKSFGSAQCTEEELVGNLRLGAAAAQRTPGR